MKRVCVFVLSLFILLSCLRSTRFDLIEAKAFNGYPVHNVDTGISYSTIQEALDALETLDGHTILVDAGIYYEHLAVNKAVLLIGESKDNTFVDGSGTSTVITLSPGANVTGFTIQNGFTGIQGRQNHTICYNNIVNNQYGGIDLHPYSLMGKDNITGNFFANNSLFGICLGVISESVIYDNIVESNEHGVVLVGGKGNVFRNNSVRDNEYNFGVPIWAAYDWMVGGLTNDIDPSNTVDGKPVYCWVGRHNEQVPQDAGYVWLTDCDNITIKDSDLRNNLQGIFLINSTNISMIENNVSNNVFGIFTAYNCINSTFIGNNVSHNQYGIYLGPYPGQSTLKNNCMDQNVLNFGFFPMFYPNPHQPPLLPFMNDIDSSNTVNGKPIYYWVNQHDRKVPEDAGYVALVNSTNMVVENLNMSNNVQCVFLMATNNTIVRNISTENSSYGIAIEGATDMYTNYTSPEKIASFNNTVTNCVLVNNGAGILLGRQSQNNTASKNVASKDLMGIAVYGGSGNLITENTITNNTISISPPPTGFHWFLQYQYPELPLPPYPYPYGSPGVLLEGGPDNIVTDNLIAYNDIGQEGGSYSRTGGNFIYHNNFIKNTVQVVPYIERAVMNNYSSGYPKEGNYWSDYNETDANSDGIGDTPYKYITYVVDIFPLMGMFHSFNTSLGCSVNVISNSTVDSFEFFESNNTIKMCVSNMTADQTCGFCRLCIPHALMNEIYHVTINGTEPLYWNYTLYDDGENGGIYFSYEHSTLEIVIVQEFPAFFITPVLMIAALLAVAAFAQKNPATAGRKQFRRNVQKAPASG